jgi:hypothetical protein
MARSSLRYALPLVVTLILLVGVRPVASAEEPLLEGRTFEAWHVMRTRRG